MIDLFRFLHVLSISVWIGAALWVFRDVRGTIALATPAPDALSARIWPALGLDLFAGIATVLTGIGLLLVEGVARPRAGITIGFVLALVRLGVMTGVRSRFGVLLARLREGGEVSAGDPTVRRMAMLTGIAHAVWLLALAAMVFPI